ncbi:MAG: tRNA (adenosine(37)-N6)-dimethylallyltransferase MiaA [Tannerella sp.]|jgi:tRNA dimethylallyltransferase|nr:tRNA (adenosine(37)-N6)-dimethylallyltransferase MiaA [Tannerella sp.]
MKQPETYELITVLGPTASGKTAFAAALADCLDTEIISADSRQVYRRMDIGTGKDRTDYHIGGRTIPCHLIDICEPGEKYNVFLYQRDFFRVFHALLAQGKRPILCGGSGLYIETVLKGYQLPEAPQNPTLRAALGRKSLPELEALLASCKTLHNKTDVDSVQRAIRAIEIEEYRRNHTLENRTYEPVHSLVVGLSVDRETRRANISRRLRSRLKEGMADEVRSLLASGIASEDLMYYGLEYKYLTQYVLGECTCDEMIARLEIAIHQFAKRQMTWFHGMERRGTSIHWIDAALPLAEKIEQTLALLT